MKRRLAAPWMTIAACMAIAFSLVLFATDAFAQTDLRAWNRDGQTWLVWNMTNPDPFTYDVYRSDSPIVDVADAEFAGRLLMEDITTPRLKLADADATWTIPDEDGNPYSLADDEGLFVHTPHAATPEYFAVVKHGETALSAENSIGPIAQALDPVQCHHQLDGVTSEDRHYAVYAHWADGREDYTDNRPDYPVMANAFANGVGHVFALYEPDDGRTGEPMPMVIGLHGGGDSNYFRFARGFSDIWQIDMLLPGAFLLAIDDALHVREPSGPNEVTFAEHTRWIGYWTGFDRFTVPTEDPPDDAMVVDYTVRRIDFILNWMLEREDEIDPRAVSIFGVSGGGVAVGFLTRLWPDRFSAGHNFVPSFQGTPYPFARYMQGAISQNLATNFPGEPDLRNFYWPTLRLAEGELPYLRVITGKKDIGDPWDMRVEGFTDIEDQRLGWALYWDERDHILNWPGSHWIGSEKHDLNALTKYRADQSFPAFSQDDQNSALEGQQPEMGETRNTGDPWGTWGGYFDWDTQTIVDTESEWSVNAWITSQSSYEPDVPEFGESRADLSIRRPQEFQPAAGETLRYEIAPADGGAATQAGEIVVDGDGLVTIAGVMMSKTPQRVTISTPGGGDDDSEPDDDTADDDDQTDDDDVDHVDNGDDDDDDGDGCGC
ncbi:MAG: hypothetical protein IT350_10940 [Deltaproteobacteria bacterium]|nr:hypothetical protein [Deltaproteobacteria bacterium]